MTDVQIIMFCTIVLAISACVMHNSTKKIADKLYRQMTGIPEPEDTTPKKKSPYGIIRSRGDNGKWGYCITKNNEIYRSDKYASSPVYPNIEQALNDLNIYEKIEGYELTVLEKV